MPTERPTAEQQDLNHGLFVNDHWAALLADRIDDSLQGARFRIGYITAPDARAVLEERVRRVFGDRPPSVDRPGLAAIWTFPDTRHLVVFDERRRTVELSRHHDVDAEARALAQLLPAA